MSTVLEDGGRPEKLGFVGLLILLFISIWVARRKGRAPATSIRLGQPQLVPLAADQAAVAAQLLATTLTPLLSGDDPEASE
jgi:hypothetical protein